MAIYHPETTPQTYSLSPRMKKLKERDLFLRTHKKRELLAPNPEFLIYHWSGECEAFAPATGEKAPPSDQVISFGDHSCRVDTGKPFPYVAQMPSKVSGFEYSEYNFAVDYAFFLDHCQINVFPNELIVGEQNWQLDEARLYEYPAECQALGFEARKVGAGGFSLAHTCPDLNIGMTLGWSGVLDKIRKNRDRFISYHNQKSVDYLNGSELIVEAIMRYLQRHADKANELYESECDPAQKELYRQVADNCHAIAVGPPQTFTQGLLWLNMFYVVERMNGHGNGYGRPDQFLYPLFRKSMDSGEITHEKACELVAELYLKNARYLSVGGRNRDGSDAVNELSWVMIEAYDMVGGYNHLGVMWHSDIDKDFYRYSCEVLARRKAGTPTLVNYDCMKQSELFNGISEDLASNVSYSGCQWYCCVGNEYNDQDVNCIVLIQPMQRAIKRCIDENISDFDGFWKVYDDEVNITADALAALKNAQYKWQHKVWPEMVASTMMHGPIERGRDMTDFRAVDVNFTSVNVLGVPNVVDSIFAIKKLVFEDGQYSLKELQDALDSDWAGNEPMRQRFLHAHKFGNDMDDVDEIAVKVSEHIRAVLESKRNIKGFYFRPSLFQFMGHTYAGPYMGATPDGRHADEFLAHGMNPMHGRNTEGISATANSLCKIDLSRYQGGSLQIELNPVSEETKANLPAFIDRFSRAFFNMNGVQINLNNVDLQELKNAMSDPANPAYQDIVFKVTGYSAHFVMMDRKLQEEFVNRVNYVDL